MLLWLTSRFIPSDSVNHKSQPPIDIIGASLSIIGLISFVYGLVGDRIQMLWVVFGIVMLLLFVYQEHRTSQPLLALELFKNRDRTSAYLMRLLFMMAMLPYWFLLPQMMQAQYHFTALQSGMAFLPLTLVNFIVAMRLPDITAKFGSNQTLVFGELFLLVGLAWTAWMDFSQGYVIAIALPMLVIGLGQGLILAPVTALGVVDTSAELAGIASGVTNTMHQIGGPIGLSVMLLVQGNLHVSLWIMAFFTLIALIIGINVTYHTKK